MDTGGVCGAKSLSTALMQGSSGTGRAERETHLSHLSGDCENEEWHM